MRRVLVTRPEPGASRTAARLRAMGVEPVPVPLSKTMPLAVDADALPVHADAVAVTSANALRHAAPDLLARLKGLPCLAVGRRTAEAAREAGFSSVVEGPGDAAALAEKVADTMTGTSLLYLCGRLRFAGFEERLGKAGVHVRAIETYDTAAVVHRDDELAAALGGRRIDAVLLYSATGAEAAGRLVESPRFGGLFADAQILALSARIAAAYGRGNRVRVAAGPSEDELLALLGRQG